MTKKQFMLKEKKRLLALKLSLEKSFIKELKVYFIDCRLKLLKGHGNNLESIKPIIESHNKRITNTLLNGTKKTADYVRLINVLSYSNDSRIKKDAGNIDNTTKDRLEKSIELARQTLKDNGDDNPSYDTINKVAANIFDNYNINRIQQISITETNGLIEASRKTIVKEVLPAVREAVHDDDSDELEDLFDLTGFWFIEDARQSIENNDDKHDILYSLVAPYKTWVAIIDNVTRESHINADGQTVGLDDVFSVGDAILSEPGDDSLGAGSEEICNCRCSCCY
jgi:hypothetical protein